MEILKIGRGLIGSFLVAFIAYELVDGCFRTVMFATVDRHEPDAVFRVGVASFAWSIIGPCLAVSIFVLIGSFGSRLFEFLLDFRGRASRRDLWLGLMAPMALCFAVIWCSYIFLATGPSVISAYSAFIQFGLFLLWPLLATCLKRCRDLDWSPWLLLIGLLPGIGLFLFLALAILPGKASSDDATVAFE